MLHMFTNNCKSRFCFALGLAHDPKRPHVGEAPNFTNHAGHETQMMRRETEPKILNTIINIFKFQEQTSLSLINFVYKSRDLQCKKVDTIPRFNASMIDTIEDPWEELCLKHRRCTC